MDNTERSDSMQDSLVLDAKRCHFQWKHIKHHYFCSRTIEENKACFIFSQPTILILADGQKPGKVQKPSPDGRTMEVQQLAHQALRKVFSTGFRNRHEKYLFPALNHKENYTFPSGSK